jgi:hypothetical protein
MAKQPNDQFGYFNTNQFALTSSNEFVGNQTINGNLTINGNIIANNFVTSSTLLFTGSTNHGSHIEDVHTYTGSVYITGSLNVIGGINGVINATNGVVSSSTQITAFGFVSGSYETTGRSIVSSSTQIKNYGDFATTGSNLFRGDQTITGSFLVSGSTTQIGNNTLIGTTQLSGSIAISGSTEFGGDLFPKEARGATIGTLERPFRDIFLQSASINIASDIPGGRGASISNTDGNVTIQAAGFQLKSGSFVSFEVSETARTQIKVPIIPAGDIGAFSIIGNVSGAYQPVTSDGSMVHITGNDGKLNRFNMDSFGSGSFNSMVFRTGRGTAESPLQLKANDTILRLAGAGWKNDTGFGGPSAGFSAVSIDFVSLNDQTSTTAGTQHQFYNSPLNQNVRTLSATLDTTGLFVSGAFTSSLEEGYTWVGGNGNRTTLVSTSSFETKGRSIISSSAQITALGFISSSQTLDTASFSTTGSNIFNGNQTITGSLTLSSGSALRINNGFYVDGNRQFNYGQFSDLTIQSASADTAYPMKLNTTDVSMGVSVVSGSFIKVANTGTYNLQFSAQLEQTSNNASEVSIWLRKDGTDIPNSNTELTIEKISGGGKLVAAWNYMIQLNANQYVQLMWCSTRSDTQLHYHDTQSTPTRPATPSVIATMTQIA